jgi:cytochrome d ubiquinol oxidase subunit II
MHLTDVWFVLIAVLWTGYLVLDGFDLGLVALLPGLGRTETERDSLMQTVGPVWDGNEVWLLVAGGATFAAFPQWYASMFSGFYLALLALLVALILRGMALEYRGKQAGAAWRRRWEITGGVASGVAALLLGVAFANIVRGVPLDADHEYTGTFFTLLNPFGLLGGLALVAVLLLHGAVFAALRTTGELRARAHATAARIWPVAVVLGAAYLLWMQFVRGSVLSAITAVIAAVALLAVWPAVRAGRDGQAFGLTAATIGFVVVTIFAGLYPDVLPSTTDPAGTLTTTNAASGSYTLGVMTWVAAVVTPIVLAYTAWTYWVFRHRITGDDHVLPERVGRVLLADGDGPAGP